MPFYECEVAIANNCFCIDKQLVDWYQMDVVVNGQTVQLWLDTEVQATVYLLSYETFC